MLRVRINRENPNSIGQNSFSNQIVSIATVSSDVALLFEEYKRGRTTYEESLAKLDHLISESPENVISIPFSVYVNIHSNHASVIFMQTGIDLQRESEETKKLAEMDRGLRVIMKKNNFQVINPTKIRRIDLYTNDGLEYKIEMSGSLLQPGLYTMFKCFEVVGISDQDIEWSYLMAAQHWYDTAANNCLGYSKRIIRELHKHITGQDLDENEEQLLNKLYISLPGRHQKDVTTELPEPYFASISRKTEDIKLKVGTYIEAHGIN